jgi:hypothetical protein
MKLPEQLQLTNERTHTIRIFRNLTGNSPNWLNNGIRLSKVPKEIKEHFFYLTQKTGGTTEKEAAKLFIGNDVICPMPFTSYKFKPAHRILWDWNFADVEMGLKELGIPVEAVIEVEFPTYNDLKRGFYYNLGHGYSGGVTNSIDCDAPQGFSGVT